MNYSYAEIKRRQKEMTSASRKMKYRMEEWFTYLGIILLITVLLMLVCGMAGGVRGLVDSAPSLEEIDFLAKGEAGTVYDSSGNVLQTLGYEDLTRESVAIDMIPECVQQAFIVSEDMRFYEHHGIDMLGLFQTVYSSVVGEKKGTGEALTITQQLVQNQMLGGTNDSVFMEKLSKAVKEQYLAIRLEDNLDKSKILEYYLNTIQLGQGMTGVQAASRRYFDKDISVVNLSEAAVLAAIAANPSEYNPVDGQEENTRRRRNILEMMLAAGDISEKAYEEALGDEVYLRIQNVNTYKVGENEMTNSYYVDAVVNQAVEDLKAELGYSETEAYNVLYRKGVRIYTCQDSGMQQICDEVIHSDDYYPANIRFYLSYQLVIERDGIEQEYNEIDVRNYFKTERQRNLSLYIKKREKAEKYVSIFKREMLKEGGAVVSENMLLVKQPQASFVLMEQTTGKVKAIVGGRGSKSVYRGVNRATEYKRQPGSALAMLSTYTPALDTAGITLASVEDDAPYNYQGVSEQLLQSQTEYDGLMTLREAIAGAKSIPAIRTLQKVSVQTGYDFLRKFSFTTLVGRQKSEDGSVYSDLRIQLALGELREGVTNLELTAAYAAIAAGGVYRQPRFYTRIVDSDGNVLLEKPEEASYIIKEETAWLLTDVMQDVIEKGNAGKAEFQKIKTEQAGYNGWTVQNTDFWFEGYTPYYTAGIWFGTDENISQKDSDYYMVIWRDIMERVHKEAGKEEGSFRQPKNIVACRICSKCGNLAVDDICDEAEGGSTVQKEYFSRGTEPVKNCTCHVRYAFCEESHELATENCPKESIYYRVLLQKNEIMETADTPNTVAKNVGTEVCDIHP